LPNIAGFFSTTPSHGFGGNRFRQDRDSAYAAAAKSSVSKTLGDSGSIAALH
jgi:hypothetical protein